MFNPRISSLSAPNQSAPRLRTPNLYTPSLSSIHFQQACPTPKPKTAVTLAWDGHLQGMDSYGVRAVDWPWLRLQLRLRLRISKQPGSRPDNHSAELALINNPSLELSTPTATSTLEHTRAFQTPAPWIFSKAIGGLRSRLGRAAMKHHCGLPFWEPGTPM